MLFFDACLQKGDLAACSRRGDIRAMKKILRSGNYTMGPNEDGYYPIIEAIEGLHLEAVVLLRDYGADMYMDVPIVGSCLHLAVFHDAANIAEYLLNTTRLASWNRKNDYGDTPMHTAVYKRRFSIIDLFQEHGIDFKIANERGQTPMILAASLKDYEMVEKLYFTGFSINDVDEDGRSTTVILKDVGKLDVLCRIGAFGRNNILCLPTSKPIDIPGRRFHHSEGFKRLYGE